MVNKNLQRIIHKPMLRHLALAGEPGRGNAHAKVRAKARAVGAGVAFVLLSRCLTRIPVGVVYAVWSGLGVALITLVAWLFLEQPLDGPALAGLALIVGGVVVINVFSKAAAE